MKVTTERLEHCQINVFVELDAAEVDDKLRQTARKISRKMNVPGYRRGHAPFAAVIRTFGREAVQQEAIDEFGQELYDAALEQIEYEPYQPGELREVEWDPFRMTVRIPIQPETDLGRYRDVRVPFEPEAVGEEKVEERLAAVQDEHAQWVPVERPAALGDQVVIDATGHVEGREVMKLEGSDLRLEEGAAAPVPGLHTQLVGMSAGESKEVTLAYPEDHADESLAGKEGTFSLSVTVVKQKEIPPLDDDLALMVGAYDTLDDLRAAVRQQLDAEAAEQAKPAYLDKVLEAIVEQAPRIDYPPQAIDREVEMALERMERNLESAGIRLERYLQMIGKTPEAYKAELRPAAETRFRKRMAMREIAKREGLKVTDEEVEAEIARLTALLKEEAGDLRQALTSPEGHLSVADDILTGRVQERIIAIGLGEPLPPEPSLPETGVGTEATAEMALPEAPAGAEAAAEAAQEPAVPEALAGAEAAEVQPAALEAAGEEEETPEAPEAVAQ
jgi:trigger factor